MRVQVLSEGDVRHLPTEIASGVVAASGLLEHPALAGPFQPGFYYAIFEAAEYFQTTGVSLPDPPFLDSFIYRFGIADPDQHYHLPMKLTPWGYSCFRGGA